MQLNTMRGKRFQRAPGGTSSAGSWREKVSTMAKKVLLLLAVAFAAFYLFTRPEGAAVAVQSAAGGLGQVFEQVQRFVSALFS